MNQTTTTEYKHILVNECNVPFIKGTSMKVVELVTSVHAYGWSPEELHFQYPHLSMSHIYSALAYYWEHKEEFLIDATSTARLKLTEVKNTRQDDTNAIYNLINQIGYKSGRG